MNSQGATDAHEFFVLEVGTCDVFVTRPGDLVPKKVKTYGPGSAFGELALLYSAPRAATVTSTSPCKVWVAERRVVATIRRHYAEKAVAVKLELLEKVPIFGVMTEKHKHLVAGALEQVRCSRQPLPHGFVWFLISLSSVIYVDRVLTCMLPLGPALTQPCWTGC